MNIEKIPQLEPLVRVPTEVADAAEQGNLVLFIGSGVSQRLGLPSWEGFAEAVLLQLANRGKINHNDVQILKRLESRKVLSIAKEIDPDCDFTSHFEVERNRERKYDVYDHLNRMQCEFVTTNYDSLLEPFTPIHSDSRTTGKCGKRIYDEDDLNATALSQLGNIVHLHGSVENYKSMIITTADYLKHYDSHKVKSFLEHLFRFRTVVFIGYGLAESEILEHILRHGSVRSNRIKQPTQLFALQGYYFFQTPVYENLYRYYRNSFGLELLGFLLDRDDFEALDVILENWSNEIVVRSKSLSLELDALLDEIGQ